MRWILLLSWLALGSGPVGAATYVVRPDGTGDFPTIQAAIDATVDGDVIELADGTFTGDGNRDIDYLGKAITVRSQSGVRESCVVDCHGSPEERHRGFIFQSGEGSGSVLEGVTITNGYTSGGGGIRCESSSPLFVRCALIGNSAFYGGGMNCWYAPSPTLRECVFDENWAEHGGGVYCFRSSPTFTDCNFIGNRGETAGGGLHCMSASSARLSNCVFSGNVSHIGGGMVSWLSDPVLVSCTFSGNLGIGYHSWGGGIYATDTSDLALSACILTENWACYGGGMTIRYASTATLTGCTVSGNTATATGGGLYCWSQASTAILFNCTVYANSAYDAGGAIACRYRSTALAQNTIFAFSPQGEAVSCRNGGGASLTCCDVYGNAGGDWVGCIADQYGIDGNISEDPLFCDPENSDFTLHEDSPCAPFTPPNEECDLIGAWPVGCGPTAVRMGTWGAIKAMYRR